VIFIAELLLDTCFIPLYMNNLYINQIYLLILSEPTDLHKSSDTNLLFGGAQFHHRNILQMDFQD